ncbi:hypothetical protein X777_14191 [Ooceraea biroi]|uniref:Uncharacterized protein n=1 Tax=Ooceraea biroi TaxID=2015173 RepID=A0A026VWE8_OOCBI|nr:hypothetical protein X777_14191 [Ooceraea biroi]
MSTSLSKNSVIPQASSSRSWISSVFDFIWGQVSLFRLPNVSTCSMAPVIRSRLGSRFSPFGILYHACRADFMPRSRRRHRSRSHSRTRSHSVGSPQYEHKRRRIDYESPQSKGTYSGERVLRSRQHERGTSQERRYKRSHRRSPSSGRQHGHRDRDRDRAHPLVHPTSSRRTRLHRHHGSSSPSQERHRHRSPSTRSQVSPRDNDTCSSISITRSCPSYAVQRRVIRDTRPMTYEQPIRSYLLTADLRRHTTSASALVLCRT